MAFHHLVSVRRTPDFEYVGAPGRTSFYNGLILPFTRRDFESEIVEGPVGPGKVCIPQTFHLQKL